MTGKFVSVKHIVEPTAPKHDLETKFISINRYNGVYVNRNLRRAIGNPRYIELEVSGTDTIRLRAFAGTDATTACDLARVIRIPDEVRDRALGQRGYSTAKVVRLDGELRADGWWYFTVPECKRRTLPLNKHRGG